MVLISKTGLLALVASLGGAASAEQPQQLISVVAQQQQQQQQRVLALDQDTEVDRNPNVPPELDITGGVNGTDEIKIEFWRAELENMLDTSGGEARIVARFYAVNGTDNSCDKERLLYSWVDGDEDFAELSDPTPTYINEFGGSPWMTGKIQDKTDINGIATVAGPCPARFLEEDDSSAEGAERRRLCVRRLQEEHDANNEGMDRRRLPGGSIYYDTDNGKTRIQMLVLIDILKSKLSLQNPLWHPAEAASVTVGDFKVCVNIQVERKLDTTDNSTPDTWVPILWRDFLVFMGVNLEDNVFSIGDEDGIEVKIDAVENATSTYEKPELAFYQCIGDTNFGEDTSDRTAIGDDVEQNGLIQMCLMPESDDVYICELEMDVDVDGNEEGMQKVSKLASGLLAADDATPAGTPAQSSIVAVYDREEVDCAFGPNTCNVQKVDIQTLAAQAGKFLNITGTVTYCFRAETGGRRLENVPFNLAPNNQQLRSLQADEGAGAEPFSFSLKIDQVEFDGDVSSDGSKDNTNSGDPNLGGGNFDTYSAATTAAFGGLLKVFGAVVAGVMLVVLV